MSETNNNSQSSVVADKPENHFFRASAADFKKINGSPIAYWVSDRVREVFDEGNVLKEIGDTRQGMATSDNNRFLRVWSEVSFEKAHLHAKTRNEAAVSGKKWFPYNKGGDFRKWYGNSEFFINWEHDGKELIDYAASLYGSPTRTIKSISEYFKPCVSWSKISSANLAMRYYPVGYLFDVAGCCIFSQSNSDLMFLLGYSNTIMVRKLLASISPTLNFEAGQIASLPILDFDRKLFSEYPKKLIEKAKQDWDSYEMSWDFTDLQLLSSQSVGQIKDSASAPEGITRQIDNIGLCKKATNPTYPLPLSIKETYIQLRTHWQEMTLETQRLEEENNRIFIDVYGLQDELTPEVPLKEITLTCNPHYRYGNNKNAEELEVLLLADTLKEFISYAVGCMFGRYALDKPGLILANQGETIADYLKQIPEPIFSADDDNVIPMLDGDWFTDDVTERFGQFLKVTFGDAHYEENIKFIEQALGKDIRKYFLKDFYTDHLKRYKKRPIYWLFSSPKGTFNALIYMHRYRPDTVSVVLNDYLREFRTKLSAHKNHLEAVSISSNASAGEKTKALKDIENHRKMIDELDVYEREVLYPLATEQIEIDLDDGVKVNYQKFGEALKKIPGLAAKEG